MKTPKTKNHLFLRAFVIGLFVAVIYNHAPPFQPRIQRVYELPAECYSLRLHSEQFMEERCGQDKAVFNGRYTENYGWPTRYRIVDGSNTRDDWRKLPLNYLLISLPVAVMVILIEKRRHAHNRH